MTSRADHIRTQLQQAFGDIRATWRTAQSLLHSRQKVIYGDSECADLVGKFSSFFVDKVRRIRDNIASALQQSSPPGVRCTTAYQSRVIGFPAGDYRRGLEAAGVHTTQDIAAGRSACLSTEGLRGNLRTGHHHTRQLVTADQKIPSTLQIRADAAATEEGGARQVVASQLQADI